MTTPEHQDNHSVQPAGSAFIEKRLPDGSYRWQRELPTRCAITMRGATPDHLRIIRKYTKTGPNDKSSPTAARR